MEALDQLLMACHSQSIKPFVESFLHMVAKLLESGEPKLQVLGTNSVSKDSKWNQNKVLLICYGKVVSEVAKYLPVNINWEDSVCGRVYHLGLNTDQIPSGGRKAVAFQSLKFLWWLGSSPVEGTGKLFSEFLFWIFKHTSWSHCIGKAAFPCSPAMRAVVWEGGRHILLHSTDTTQKDSS